MSSTEATEVASPTPETEASQPLIEPIRPFPKWPVLFVAIVAIAGLLIALTWSRTVGYYALAPGDVLDVDDYVVLNGDQVGEDGELYFLTVELAEVNAIEAIPAG